MKSSSLIASGKSKAISPSAALDQVLEDIMQLNKTLLEVSYELSDMARSNYNEFDQQLVEISRDSSKILNEKSELLISHAVKTVETAVDLGCRRKLPQWGRKQS